MFEFTFLEQTEKTLNEKEFAQIKLELESMWTPALLKKIRVEKDAKKLKAYFYVELLTSKRNVSLSRIFSRISALERTQRYREHLEDVKKIENAYREKANGITKEYKKSIRQLRSEKENKIEVSKLYKMNKKQALKKQFQRIIEGN